MTVAEVLRLAEVRVRVRVRVRGRGRGRGRGRAKVRVEPSRGAIPCVLRLAAALGHDEDAWEIHGIYVGDMWEIYRRFSAWRSPSATTKMAGASRLYGRCMGDVREVCEP